MAMFPVGVKTMATLATERAEQIRRVRDRSEGRRAAGILTEREEEEARRFWEETERQDRGRRQPPARR